MQLKAGSVFRNCGLLAMLLCVLGAAAEPIEVPLTFAELPEDGGGRLRGWTAPGVVDPAMDVKKPSPGAYVAFFGIGERNDFLFALDKTAESDAYHNRLYVDVNQNHDLTDDPVLEGREDPVNEDYGFVKFPAVDVDYELEGKTLPYRVSIWLYRRYGKSDAFREPMPQIMGSGVWTGAFSVNGTEYKIWLGDSDFSGDFGDKASKAASSAEYLSFSGDHFCVTRPDYVMSPYDGMPLGEHLFVQDKHFKVEVKTAERKAVLTPVEESAVAVKIDPEVVQAELISRDFRTALCLFDPAPVVHVPADTYHVVTYLRARTEEQGDRWVLAAYVNPKTEMLKAAEGAPGGVLELPVGPPYRGVVVNAENRFKKTAGDAWKLTLSIKGRGGEDVRGIYRMEGASTQYPLSEKQPNTPLEPKWKVVTEDGEVVANGVFEYG